MTTPVETKVTFISKSIPSKALANYHNEEAKKLALKNKFTEALEHAEIASRHSYSMSTLQNKAQILYKKKDFPQSIRQFQIALSVGRANKEPDDEIAQVELGLSNAYAQNGDIQNAKNHYRTYLQLKGFVENINSNGATSVHNDNNEVKDTRIRIQLLEAEIEYAFGNWLMEAKSYQEAINSFKKSYSIYAIHEFNRARTSNINEEIGNAYMHLNNINEARKYYTNYVQDNVVKEIYELHDLLTEETKFKLIESGVDNQIGKWYTKSGQRKEAIKQYLLAHSQYKLWFKPLYNVAKEYYLMGIYGDCSSSRGNYRNYYNCINYCKKAANLCRKNGKPKWELAMTLTLSGDAHAMIRKLKKAINLYKEALNLYGDSNEEAKKTLFYLEAKFRGLNLHKNGYYVVAIEQYKKALEFKPEETELYFNIGRCYYNLNDNNNAANYYYKAMITNSMEFIKSLDRVIYKKKTRSSTLTKNRF